jgi:O-phosphoseryl-tRNA(Cys) synthetase
MALGIGVEDLAFMAYEASKINKIVVPSEFDTFVKGLTNIEVVDTETANPT